VQLSSICNANCSSDDINAYCSIVNEGVIDSLSLFSVVYDNGEISPLLPERKELLPLEDNTEAPNISPIANTALARTVTSGSSSKGYKYACVP
jgi:hypothetical protein